MPISNLPPVPARSDSPETFVTKADALVAALPTFVSETNALAASLNSLAAGGAIAIPYVYDGTSNANGDPGSGKIRFNQFVAQNTTTALYASLIGADGKTYTAVLDFFDDSGSGVKGQIRLVKTTDSTKWILFNITVVTTNNGTRVLTVAVIAASDSKPFNTGDALVMHFQRTGDIGSAGTILRRTSTITTTASLSADIAAFDMVVITGQNQNLTIANPTGSPTAGQQLVIAVKDNGTSRPIAYGTLFRTSTDLPSVTATNPGKWLYLGFFYNSTDVKWDMISVLNNIG